MGPGPQDNGCGDICCGAHACRGIKATGRSIHCAGSAACAQTTVADGAEESVITVTDGHVECNGGYACQQAKIHFKGTRACMYCPTTRSCRYATLTVAAGTCLQITCLLNHQQACEGVTVTGPGDCYYTSPADEPQDRPQGCTRVMKEEDGCALVQRIWCFDVFCVAVYFMVCLAETLREIQPQRSRKLPQNGVLCSKCTRSREVLCRLPSARFM